MTILVEPPALPIPASAHDPRQAAITSASDELARIGVPTERQTILVAGGLTRKPGRRTLESLVLPEHALRFRGELAVHDSEADDLVDVGVHDGVPISVNPALVETDAVVVVTAAETVLNGGPSALLAASAAETQRTAPAESLLETHNAPGWERALAVERAVGERVPLVGASLTLDLPRLSGALRGYPYEPAAVTRVARSRLARAFGLLPAAVRGRVLGSISIELTASAVFAGPPSTAHAEALVRSVDTESTLIEEPVDVICVGVPRTTQYLPRERPNALLSATLGLGYALRLWRDAPPVRDGGTAILVTPLRRRFAHPTQTPYRAFFQASRTSRDVRLLAEAERAAAADPRAIEAYRAGRTCHPRLPFADWDACQPVLDRLGRGGRRRLPRRGRGPAARLRPHPRRHGRPRDGARPRRRLTPNRVPALAALLPAARRLAV